MLQGSERHTVFVKYLSQIVQRELLVQANTFVLCRFLCQFLHRGIVQKQINRVCSEELVYAHDGGAFVPIREDLRGGKMEKQVSGFEVQSGVELCIPKAAIWLSSCRSKKI